MVPILKIPSSKYIDSIGVEIGVFRIFLSSNLSTDSRWLMWVEESPCQLSALVSMPLRKMLVK